MTLYVEASSELSQTAKTNIFVNIYKYIINGFSHQLSGQELHLRYLKMFLSKSTGKAF